MVVENKKVNTILIERGPIILFSNNDYPERFDHDHDDPMVVITIIHNYTVRRILVNQESSIDILYNAIATSMNIQKRKLRPYLRNLIRFSKK